MQTETCRHIPAHRKFLAKFKIRMPIKKQAAILGENSLSKVIFADQKPAGQKFFFPSRSVKGECQIPPSQENREDRKD
jgi:hypothetical protein